MYQTCIKRVLDVLCAGLFLLLFFWVYLILAVLIFVDDPGPVTFSQKRVGRDKKFFQLHKFRSMKRNAPRDVPTHLLTDPERYITRFGRFLRRSSLDELPQVWDIFVGNMSVVGPRPALWNQDDLVAERDRLEVNGCRPGLTGWAQINGRDELAIEEKARLDGEYAAALRQGGWTAFRMDLRCFFGTFLPVFRGDGYLEGSRKGQNEQHKEP